MAVGDEINYANYKAMVPTAWRTTPSWTDTNVTVYLSSCSFVAQIRVTSVWFRKSRIWLTSYYYNGYSWVQAYTGYLSESGGSSDSTKYYHNRADEGITSADQHQHHLWKFVISMDPEGSSHGHFNIWAGGLETMNETEYNNYFKGHKIHGIVCSYSDSSTDSNWVSSKYPLANRGTKISIADGTYKNICYEKNYND